MGRDRTMVQHANCPEALHHLAIQWSLRSPAVTSSIIGARTVAQLDDSLDALQLPMPDEGLPAAIDTIAPGEKKKHAEG
jgi:aryl-alcohol dehydrogenase-like predicted oxidoreductase